MIGHSNGVRNENRKQNSPELTIVFDFGFRHCYVYEKILELVLYAKMRVKYRESSEYYGPGQFSLGLMGLDQVWTSNDTSLENILKNFKKKGMGNDNNNMSSEISQVGLRRIKCMKNLLLSHRGRETVFRKTLV